MVKVRKATKGDIASIVELSKIAELKTAAGGFISESYFKEFMDEAGIVYVAEDNDDIVGYVLGEPMKGKLANLGLLSVHKDRRGEGIGKMLLEAFREACDERGLTFILLYAPQFNENTLEFYRKAGFTEGKAHVMFVEDRTNS